MDERDKEEGEDTKECAIHPAEPCEPRAFVEQSSRDHSLLDEHLPWLLTASISVNVYGRVLPASSNSRQNPERSMRLLRR